MKYLLIGLLILPITFAGWNTVTETIIPSETWWWITLETDNPLEYGDSFYWFGTKTGPYTAFNYVNVTNSHPMGCYNETPIGPGNGKGCGSTFDVFTLRSSRPNKLRITSLSYSFYIDIDGPQRLLDFIPRGDAVFEQTGVTNLVSYENVTPYKEWSRSSYLYNKPHYSDTFTTGYYQINFTQSQLAQLTKNYNQYNRLIIHTSPGNDTVLSTELSKFWYKNITITYSYIDNSCYDSTGYRMIKCGRGWVADYNKSNIILASSIVQKQPAGPQFTSNGQTELCQGLWCGASAPLDSPVLAGFGGLFLLYLYFKIDSYDLKNTAHKLQPPL